MNQKRIWSIVAFVGIVVVIYLFATHQNDKKYIDLVKEGSPSSYAGITYEKAFNNYFGDCKWSYFASDDGDDVVEFNGKCSYRGQEADIKIQFVVDLKNNRFSAYTASINGIIQSQLELASIIQLVFDAY